MMLALKVFFSLLFRRKAPLFMFTTPGINDEGQIQLEMEWNDSFLEHVRNEGFIGHSPEECIQMFMMSFTHQSTAEAMPETSNTSAHPFLNEETGRVIRR